MGSMQLHDIARHSDVQQPHILQSVHSFINISSIDELSYRRSKTSFGCVNVKW